MNLDPIILAELQRGGPPLWVAGRTYQAGTVARSPANLQTYVRKATGVAAADPSADAGGWMHAAQGMLSAIDAVSDAVGSASTAIGSALNEIAGVGEAVAAARTEIAGVSSAVQARGIKSVQRGVASVPGSPGAPYPKFVDVTIAAVNPDKTMCNRLTNRTQAGDTFASQLQLISPTVLRVTNSVKTVTKNGTEWFGVDGCSWEVIEWN